MGRGGVGIRVSVKSSVLGIFQNIHRSPRLSRGDPRMLLALVREFESHYGEILKLFAQIKKGSTAGSAKRG